MKHKLSIYFLSLGNKCLETMTKSLHENKLVKRDVYRRIYNFSVFMTNHIDNKKWAYFPKEN